MANVKEQLASVREVVPHRKKEDILLVLQHFDNDVPKTIQAFMEDGAAEVLKEWNVANKRKTINNKNKKKRGKSQQSAGQEDGAPSANRLQEECISNNNNIDKPIEAARDSQVGGGKPNWSSQQPKPTSSATLDVKPAQHQSGPMPADNSPKQQRRPKPGRAQLQPGGNPGSTTQSQPQEPREHPTHAQTQPKPKPQQGRNPRESSQTQDRDGGGSGGNRQASGPAPDRTGNDRSGLGSDQAAAPKQGQSSEGMRKRDRNVSESSSVADPSKPRKTGMSLDKSSKDLQRTVVSLTRHKNVLDEEIEKAEKRLKKAFEDARASLKSREEELMRQIQEIKRQATSLLDDRQHRAFELKQEISRAVSKTDSELLELRADIKHFVSERKIDEEIGRSSRFTGNPDKLQEAVKNFGEVLPIRSTYSERRHSLTSLTSMDSLSRPTSVSDDHGGLLSRSASALENKVSAPTTPTSPTTPDGDDMHSEVAKMAAKMQRSLQSQRGRGPRNPRPQGDGVRQVQQGSNPRQGQSAKEGSRQDQRGNRGRHDGPSRNSPRGAEDKPHSDTMLEGRRNDRPHNDRTRNDRPRSDRPRHDRGEGGRGKDGEVPRNKDRNIRRREQYRRRHDQGGEAKPEVGADKETKNEVSAVPHPDTIPLTPNEPSTPKA
ncbi:SPATS2-like protein isoform X2 [Acanthaster planci]|nr:SPATS2-like protein isoform X2 [Acanthaster planci]XP_022109390.1 SPATS2-like protein isoform X2 [Acanthaster planci]XP_022109399.1 SPATS2-like protein isoform X2 [Acanthaster planci]